MSSIIALTRLPSPAMNDALRPFAAHAEIDVARVNEQHAAYRSSLSALGARVSVIAAAPASPDCVFIEDTAVVLDEIAVLCSMGAASRRDEPRAIEAELRAFREIVRIELPSTIDGGDVAVLGRTILVGASERTNAEGARALADATRRFGYEVRRVPIRGCLHLKTACTALPDGRLLANPRNLDLDALSGIDRIDVDAETANVACVGDAICMGAAYEETALRLEREGFRVTRVDLSELSKADGCATCLSLLFRV
jgi:dimethylargininase